MLACMIALLVREQGGFPLHEFIEIYVFGWNDFINIWKRLRTKKTILYFAGSLILLNFVGEEGFLFHLYISY